MEPFDHLGEYGHHVVTIFKDRHGAEKALEELRLEGIPAEDFSITIRHGEELPSTEAGGQKLRKVIMGVVIGASIGVLTGVMAFGAGAGMWTLIVMGAAIGASIGIELSDYRHAWEGQYRAAVSEGATMVTVSTDDALIAAVLVSRLEDSGADQVNHFDRRGTEIGLVRK